VRLASAATGEVLRDYDPQQEWVTAVAFDLSSGVLASGGSDGSVVLRDLADDTQQRRSTDSRVWRIVVAGDLIATAHEDGSVHVEDMAAGRAVFETQFDQRVTGLDLDRGRLLVGRYDGRVLVIELDGAQVQVDLDASEDTHPVVAFSPDGRRFAVGSGDRTVRLYDAENGELCFSAEGHEAGVTGVAFTPDGSRLVTSATDGLVKLWDAESGRLALTLRADERGLGALALSPDGRRIAGASYSRTVFVWDSQDPEPIARTASRPR
jgi:WD40 repeat protein